MNEQTKQFIDMFNTNTGSGDDELLRIASQYSRQFNINQIRAICFLETVAEQCEDKHTGQVIIKFIEKYKELKRYNNTLQHIKQSLEAISGLKMIRKEGTNLNFQR